MAGVDFHPSGVALASGGGEGAVKIWDFAQQRCVLTLSDHKQVGRGVGALGVLGVFGVWWIAHKGCE